jgi:hypothetical protein
MRLTDLGARFLRIRSTGFGGPMALLGLMQQQLVERSDEVTPDDFADGVAVGQMLPGPVAVGCATFLGHRRLTLLRRREGWPANHKLVYRLYKEEALGLRRKLPRRRVSAVRRENVPAPSRCNETWSMDFMADQLYSGRPIRILTDDHCAVGSR